MCRMEVGSANTTRTRYPFVLTYALLRTLLPLRFGYGVGYEGVDAFPMFRCYVDILFSTW